MSLVYFDSHNHLQDPRLGPDPGELVAGLEGLGIRRLVVNGTREEDWPRVGRLAREHGSVLPCFGLHPWYVRERSPRWQEILRQHLDAHPGAGLGEVGLDRWMPEPDLAGQEEVFLWQLDLAARRDLPLTIHCLKAWGWLDNLLRRHPLPRRGFLLHSYGGPAEMVEPLARLGAYFSFSAHFAHARKAGQREAFRRVPPDRLLIETDAPDMLGPEELVEEPRQDPQTGRPINHPRNLIATYRYAAGLFEEPVEALAHRVEGNFRRFFGQNPGL